MSTKLERGMISEAGRGWAVTDYDGNPKRGRWETEEEAIDNGLAGLYLLSGCEVVRVDA